MMGPPPSIAMGAMGSGGGLPLGGGGGGEGQGLANAIGAAAAMHNGMQGLQAAMPDTRGGIAGALNFPRMQPGGIASILQAQLQNKPQAPDASALLQSQYPGLE
jgi:hypothetical protein